LLTVLALYFVRAAAHIKFIDTQRKTFSFSLVGRALAC
jgi:hypothetical protein